MALMVFAIFCAYFAKGVAGFANTLILNSILSFQKSIREITPVDFILGIPTNIYFTVKERKNISLKIVLPLVLVVYAGLIPGTFLLKFGNDRPLKMILGVLVIVLGIEMFFREKQRKKVKQNKAVLIIIGIMSGILCGLFGIGAFLAAYMARTTENQRQFKGNLCFVFLMENLFRGILYYVTGIFNLEILKLSLILFPVMAAGFLLGVALSKRLDEKIVKRIIIILLIIMGVSLILKNIG